jgi:hypothetical protein
MGHQVKLKLIGRAIALQLQDRCNLILAIGSAIFHGSVPSSVFVLQRSKPGLTALLGYVDTFVRGKFSLTESLSEV